MTHPWNKRADETSKAHAAFSAYLDMGPSRSLARLCDVLGKTRGYQGWLEQWSSSHDWVSRSEAWDAHVQEREREAIISERVKAKRQRIKAANACLTQGLKALQKLDPDDASWRDVSTMVKMALDALRTEYESEKSDDERKEEIRDVVAEIMEDLEHQDPAEIQRRVAKLRRVK